MTIARYAAVLCLVLAATVQAEDDYEIRMTHAVKAGDSLRISGSGYSEESQIVQADGEEPAAAISRKTSAIDGTVDVLAVSEKGVMTKASITIESFTSPNGDEAPATVVLPKGTVVVIAARENDTESYTVDGEELPGDVVALLDMYALVSGKESRDDDLFGSKDRQKVGDTWPIARETLAARLAEMKQKGIALESISGEATLVSVREIDGVPCLQVKGTMTITDMPTRLPAEFTVEKAELVLTRTTDHPIDAAIGRLAAQQRADLEIVAHKPGLSLTLKWAQQATLRYTYPKPAAE